MIHNNFLKKLLITTATITVMGAGINTAIAKPHAKDSKQFHLITDHASRALFSHGTAMGSSAGNGLDSLDFDILYAMGLEFSTPATNTADLNTQTSVNAHAIGGASDSIGADIVFQLPGSSLYSTVGPTTIDTIAQHLNAIKTTLQDKTHYIGDPTVSNGIAQIYTTVMDPSGDMLPDPSPSLRNDLLDKYAKSGLSGAAANLDNFFTQSSIASTFGFAIDGTTGAVTQTATGTAAISDSDVQSLNAKLRQLYNALRRQSPDTAQAGTLIDQIATITGLSVSDKSALLETIKNNFDIHVMSETAPHFLKVYDLHLNPITGYLTYQAHGSHTIKAISAANSAIIDDALKQIKSLQPSFIRNYKDAKWAYDAVNGDSVTMKRLLAADIAKLEAAKTTYAAASNVADIDPLLTRLKKADTDITALVSDDLYEIPHLVAHAGQPPVMYISGLPRSTRVTATPAKTPEQMVTEIMNEVILISQGIADKVDMYKKKHDAYVQAETLLKAQIKRITDITGGTAPTIAGSLIDSLEQPAGTHGHTDGTGAGSTYVPISTPASHAIDTALKPALSANLGINVSGDNVLMTLKDANGHIVKNADGSPKTISLNYQAAKIANGVMAQHQSAKTNFDSKKSAYDSFKGGLNDIDMNYRALRQALLSAQATLNNEEGKVPPNTTLINDLKTLINAPHTQSIFTAITVLDKAYKEIESDLKTVTRSSRSARAVTLTMTPAALQNAITMAQTAIAAASRPIADFKKAIADYKVALEQLNRLSTAMNPLLRPAPVLGNILSQTIRDVGMLNQYLLQRRSMHNLGLWSYSDVAIIESDAQYRSQYFNDDAMEQGNENLAIGMDQTITDLITAGAFFNYATNKQKSKTLKQDSKSYTIGAYATYKLFPQLYLHDKLSLTMATFNNKNDRGHGIITKSDIDTKSINNEFSVGVNNDDNSLSIETYLNSIYMLSTDFKERETTLAGGKLYNIDANIDATFYNSVGGRVIYLHPEYYTVSYLPDWQFTPYMKSFIDLALTGKELKGDFTQVYVKSNKVKFEDVKALSYGFTIGQAIKFSTLQSLSATISYNLNHYNNTSHSLSVGLNLGL